MVDHSQVVHILVVVLVHMVVMTDGGTIGSGVVHGRGILVDAGSSSGADGSGHVGCEVCLGW